MAEGEKRASIMAQSQQDMGVAHLEEELSEDIHRLSHKRPHKRCKGVPSLHTVTGIHLKRGGEEGREQLCAVSTAQRCTGQNCVWRQDGNVAIADDDELILLSNLVRL